MNKWDQRFLNLAEYVSKWSKDPSTQVGAVLAKGKILRSIGFNGLPFRIRDRPELLNNRDKKYPRVMHAEINASIFANMDVDGCTLYTWPFMPCARCASYYCQLPETINRVVAPYDVNERWLKEFKASQELFTEAGIQLELIGGPVGGYWWVKEDDNEAAKPSGV